MVNEQNQHSILSLFTGVGGLDGIDEARDVQARPKTNLETLLELALHTVTFFSAQFFDDLKHYGSRPCCTDFLPVYCYIHPILKNLCFDETDISSFVKSFENHDYPKHESHILGVFTSCLAYALTERNREKRKRTRIYVNGNGAKFDYLFCSLPYFDELIIENFSGDWIGHSNGSKTSFISRGTPLENYITKICGDPERYYKVESSIMEKSTRNKKRTKKRIVGINLKGNSIFGYPSGIDQIVLIDIDGEYAGVNCSAGNTKDYVNQLVGVNITGDNALCGLGKEGIVNHVVAVNIEGKEAFSLIAAYYPVNKVVVDNVRGDKAFSRIGSPAPINQMVFNDSSDLASDVKFNYKNGGSTVERLQGEYYFKGGCKKLICIENATPAQQKVIKRERIEDILRLAHSLPGKPYQEVLRIADELYVLRPKVPVRFFEDS